MFLCFSFHFNRWVRFGYDPRKDFESRYYQQFDYRMRTQVGCKEMIDLKRTNKIHVPNTKPAKPSIIDREIAKKQEIIYSPYFEIGNLPQSRQVGFENLFLCEWINVYTILADNLSIL